MGRGTNRYNLDFTFGVGCIMIRIILLYTLKAASNSIVHCIIIITVSAYIRHCWIQASCQNERAWAVFRMWNYTHWLNYFAGFEEVCSQCFPSLVHADGCIFITILPWDNWHQLTWSHINYTWIVQDPRESIRTTHIFCPGRGSNPGPQAP